MKKTNLNFLIILFSFSFLLADDQQNSVVIERDECSDFSQDECETLDYCYWNVEDEECVRLEEGEDGENDYECSDVNNPFECYAIGCNWEMNSSGEGMCVEQENMDDGGWDDCDPDLICAQVVTCFNNLLYPTACGPLNCDEPIGECDNNDGGGWGGCAELTQDECTENPDCDWSVQATPFGTFEVCLDSDWNGDGGWNDDGGWGGCAEFTQDECTENPDCDWSVQETPFGTFEVCLDANWNDDGGWNGECSDLGYEDCMAVDFCDWISDNSDPISNGYCTDTATVNPCSDFNQEDCEWYDACVWTDQGCQEYNWDEEGCWEDGEFYCIGCELFISDCEFLECTNNGWVGPFTIDNEDCHGEDDGGHDGCEGLSYQDCEMMEDCEWISDSDNPNNWGSCVEINDENDGPPECLLDCEGIENVNPSENPYEACDWIISIFGNDPGFGSCANDCDEETMMQIYEVIEGCYECLQNEDFDCADVFNNNDCSDLTIDECVDAENCEPNYNAAGQYEGCVENNNIEEGCWEGDEFYCVGCELFVNHCEYYECTDNGWAGPFTLDNEDCSGSDSMAVLSLGNSQGLPGGSVTLPFYISSNEVVYGVQFTLEVASIQSNQNLLTAVAFDSLDDCFSANFNNVNNSVIGIIFSLEGCSYPPSQLLQIANLVFEISDNAPAGQEINLFFENTIVAGQSGVEIPSYGQDSVVLVGMVGDVNSDGAYNVLDVVSLINFILLSDEPDEYEFWASDLNEDNLLNVLDVVLLVGLILD